MSELLAMLGKNGIMGVIGTVIFLYCFKYSVNIFDWIEKQTFGTKEYILEKFELLFIDVKHQHVTYVLFGLSLGLGGLTFLLLGLIGHWVLGLILGIIVGYLGFKIPRPIVNFMVKKRIKAYSDQMVDGLTLLSNGIRAGLSVPQSLGMIVSEMPKPISQEFGLMLQQNRVGVSLEDCFDNLAKRIPTEDNDMFVSSVNILRETGGNLAETFDTIVDVIRERVRLQQKVDTFTAQGMFQGMTIFFMPFGIGAIYYSSDPDTMSLMFTTPIGWALFFVALFLDLLGGIIILKIVQIKV